MSSQFLNQNQIIEAPCEVHFTDRLLPSQKEAYTQPPCKLQYDQLGGVLMHFPDVTQ